MVCEIRNGNTHIGGAFDRRVWADEETVNASLSMNAGAQVPAGGEVSLWCRVQGGGGSFNYGSMQAIRLGGFF